MLSYNSDSFLLMYVLNLLYNILAKICKGFLLSPFGRQSGAWLWIFNVFWYVVKSRKVINFIQIILNGS